LFSKAFPDWGVTKILIRFAQILRPDFGVWRCFFSNPASTFVYLYLPIVILQTANAVFFAATINNLRKTWNLTRCGKIFTIVNYSSAQL
jgi:hypothetical protein